MLTVDDIILISEARAIVRGGHRVELTGAEFEILRLLLDAAGAIVDREKLFAEALGRSPNGMDRSIDNHISNLRKKLGPTPAGLPRIRSIRGVGYIYCKDAMPLIPGAAEAHSDRGHAP